MIRLVIIVLYKENVKMIRYNKKLVKSIAAVTLAFSMMFSVVACGKGEADNKDEATTEADNSTVVKEELVKFINEDLPSIAPDRDAAVAIYNSYFEEDSELTTDDWHTKLVNEAKVDYEVYMHSLNEIEVSTDEVANLKSIFVQSAQAQSDAIGLVISALDEGNADYLEQASQKMAESKDYMSQYETQLISLCNTYEISINVVSAGSLSDVTVITTDDVTDDVTDNAEDNAADSESESAE